MKTDESKTKPEAALCAAPGSAGRNEFSDGWDSMARHCLAALELVNRGDWTLDDVRAWLHASIANDPDLLTPNSGIQHQS